MKDFLTWSLEELMAWAGNGTLSNWLESRIDMALPRSDALQYMGTADIFDILNAADPFREHLARLFAASALLSTDADVPWDLFQKELPNVPLKDWRHGTWRLASIPCMGDKAEEVTLLCGHSAHELPEHKEPGLRSEAEDAIEVAVTLAAKKWGGHFACWHWAGNNTIYGASLGLPVFLAFGSAAENFPMPQALATGKLNPEGGIESVAHVENKASLASGRSFFIPESNDSARFPEGVAVRHVDGAWDLWKGCGLGATPHRLRTLLRLLNEPARLFPFMMSCNEAELRFLETDQRISQLRKHLKTDPCYTELRPALMQIATSKNPAHRKSRDLFLKLFPATDLDHVARSAPHVAWRLAMLHMRAYNHSGHIREAAQIREIARQWEEELEFADHEEELISHSLSVVGVLHNAYRFQEDPWKALGPDLAAKLRKAEEDHLTSGRRKNKPLGDWYGTLAQHHAFRGELPEAERLLAKAVICFEGQPEDQRQSLSCRFFARLDAGKPEALDDLLNVLEIEHLDRNLSSHIQRIDNDYTRSWVLFALARYAVDSDASPALYTALAGAAETLAQKNRIWGMSPEGHPWQLILYNLGFLAETTAARARLWQKSLDICLHDKSGPTIKMMALLPLSAMKAHASALPEDVESIVSQICDIIRDSLDITHFETVLSEHDWAEALDRVMENKVNLFPFNYR